MVWLHLADVPSDDDNDTSRDVLAAMLGIPTDGTPGEQLWALMKLFGELVMQLASAGEYKLLAVIGSMLAGSLFSIALTCWVLSSWSWYGLLELVPALALDGGFTGAMLYYTLGIVCVVEVGSYLWERRRRRRPEVINFPFPLNAIPEALNGLNMPNDARRNEVLGAMEQLAGDLLERLEGRDPEPPPLRIVDNIHEWLLQVDRGHALIGFAVGSLMIQQTVRLNLLVWHFRFLLFVTCLGEFRSTRDGIARWRVRRRFRRAQDVLNEVNAAAGNMAPPPPCTSAPPARSAARRRVCSASAARFLAVVGL